MPSPSSDINIDDDKPDIKKPIYIIGKELIKNEISVYNEIISFRNLRIILMNSTIYPCQLCPNFEAHVNFSNFIIKYIF